MKVLAAFFGLFLFLTFAAAQERFVKPVDEASRDKSFSDFRTKLIEAAKNRDAKYVLSIVDPNIKIGFGGDDGIANFKKSWKLDRADSPFWKEFLAVIGNGGNFEGAGKTDSFYAPYTFNSFPNDLDAFTYSAIFGSNVNLRARPDTKSKVIARLSYNVVKVDFDNSVKKSKNADDYVWLKIETLGGQKGFVNADFVRSPIDYRAGFDKINGKWKLSFFAAGD